MCQDCATGSVRFSRRDILKVGAAGAVALAIPSVTFAAPAAVAGSPSAVAGSPSAVPSRGTQLVLLGTAGGPPVMNGHSGIASVLQVDGRNYVIDCGRGAVTQYKAAGLRFDALASIFITHLHADHLADYYDFFLLEGWGPVGGDSADRGIVSAVSVYGPGPAGALPDAFGGAPVATVAPEDPTPGIRALTDRCIEAYAYSTNIFMRDSGSPDVRDLIDVHEIALPDVGADPLTNTAPPMQPFPVMEDDAVRVTAVLVPHGPVFPSFALRFDTDAGSVAFSGDTAKCDNVVTLAKGADILVHEAIDLDYMGSLGTSAVQLSHLETSHTRPEDAGAVAQAAGVGTLVLSHLAPGDVGSVPDERWIAKASQTFSGRVVRAHELETISLGPVARTGGGRVG